MECGTTRRIQNHCLVGWGCYFFKDCTAAAIVWAFRDCQALVWLYEECLWGGFYCFQLENSSLSTSTKPHAHQALPVFCPEVIRKPESTTGNTRGANLCLKLAHILPKPARDMAQQNPNRNRSPMELTFTTGACPSVESIFFSFWQAIVFIF